MYEKKNNSWKKTTYKGDINHERKTFELSFFRDILHCIFPYLENFMTF